MNNLFIINDIRNTKDFQKTTFGGFSKNEVISIFNKSLMDGKIEEACFWSSELILSHYYELVYEKIFIFYLNHIHINNPNFPYYYLTRFEMLIQLINNKYKDNKSEIRNNQILRNHVAELCCIICESKKNKKKINILKLNSNDFDTNTLKKNFLADNDNYVNTFLLRDDPNELKIIINEFYYCLTNKKYENCIYWLSWLVQWEKILKKNNGNFSCAYRKINNINQRDCNDFVWLIWEIILTKSQIYNKINEQIVSLYKLFKYDYVSSKKNKRLIYIILSIQYLTLNMDFNSPIMYNYNLLIQCTGNINYIYYESKKNEKHKKDEQLSYNEFDINSIITNYKTKIKKNEQVKKIKKLKISEDSYNKINMVDQIYNKMFNK